MISLWACFLSPGGAQTPAPRPSGTPSAAASPANDVPTVAIPEKATPAVPAPVSATPASLAPSTPYNPAVSLTPRSDDELLEQMRNNGTVGRSTFVDKIRRVAWSLAVISFLIYILAKLVSKSALGKNTLEKMGLPTETDSLIEVLEKVRISPGRSIMMVRVGPKVLALGVTESGFRTLTEIDGELIKQHQDEVGEVRANAQSDKQVPPQGPTEIAKHYLSIIPGLKK